MIFWIDIFCIVNVINVIIKIVFVVFLIVLWIYDVVILWFKIYGNIDDVVYMMNEIR